MLEIIIPNPEHVQDILNMLTTQNCEILTSGLQSDGTTKVIFKLPNKEKKIMSWG